MGESSRLPKRVRDAIKNPGNEIVCSPVSAYEVGLLQRLGRIELPGDVESVLASSIEANRLQVLALDDIHGARAGGLPLHHRDPFDRMIIAQALVEGLPVATPDRAFEPYGVPLVW
jgi:PIN domain nuclease of toxin-antitoxin system